MAKSRRVLGSQKKQEEIPSAEEPGGLLSMELQESDMT